MLKRILGIVLTIVLMINMFVFSFSIEALNDESDYKGRFVLSSSSDMPMRGEIITITVSIQNNYPVSVIGSLIGYSSEYYDIVGNGFSAVSVLGDWPVGLIAVTQNPPDMYHPSYTSEMRETYDQIYVSISWLLTLALSKGDTQTDTFQTVTPMYSFKLRVKDDAPEDGKGHIWMDPIYQRVENMWPDARNSSKITRGGEDVADGELMPYGQTIDFSSANLFDGDINYDCMHINTRWVTILEPTCTVNGLEQSFCLDCNEFYDDVVRDVKKLNHPDTYWETSFDSTCTEEGMKVLKCRLCGEMLELEDIPPKGHDYEAVVTVPTCVTKGYTTNTCKNCGDSFISDYTNVIDHTWGEWIVAKEATCSETGVERRECTFDRCSEEETRAIPATGHDYESVVIEPNCIAEGFTRHTCKNCGDSFITDYTDIVEHTWSDWTVIKEATCTEYGEERRICIIDGCGETETRTISAFGHDYEVVVTIPTCTEQGFTTHTCKNCGDSYITDYTDIIDHAWGDWTIEKEATCTDDGLESRICIVEGCGETETRTISAFGHDYEIVVAEPTCTEQGFATHICKSCGDEFITDYTEPTGHIWADWEETKSATCVEDGEEKRICSICGAEETRIIPEFGHDYEIIVTEPTCTEQGFTTHICKNCGDEFITDYTEPAGHIWADWEEIKSATCVEDGEEKRICSVCGAEETRIIPAFEHDYEGVVTAPTCTEQGFTTQTCKNCGDKYITDYTEPLGHIWGDWEVVKEATRTEDGEEKRICTACDAEETRIITAINNILSVVDGGLCVIYNDKNYITSYNPSIDIYEQLKVVNGEYSLVVYPSTNGSGTGTIILVIKDNEVLIEYTIAIMGDLNGDGAIDAFDATIITSYCNFEMIPTGGYDSVYAFVADANNDGTIDAFDETIIRASVNFEIYL